MDRLHADENFSRLTVEELRKLGHDVLTAQEAGLAHQGIDDEAVLTFATAEGRALLTLNRHHFFRIHRTTPNHSGIIACTGTTTLRPWLRGSMRHSPTRPTSRDG